MTFELRITLESDATFGRGEGVAGLVDTEVEHDLITGLPFVRGRTLKGLLVEECANILFSLGSKAEDFAAAAQFLFGHASSRLDDEALLYVGPATFPDILQQAIRAETTAEQPMATQVLDSLTGIRHQTAVDESSGAPKEGSLRTIRVLLRGTELTATLNFIEEPGPTEMALLAACTRGLRRAGLGRTRGSGRIQADLLQDGQHVTAVHMAHFRQLVEGGAA
jgi:hypothetical protein